MEVLYDLLPIDQFLSTLGHELPFLCPIFANTPSPCLLQLGDNCKANEECASAWCYNGVCFTPLDTGEKCGSDDECLSFLCAQPDDSVAGDGTTTGTTTTGDEGGGGNTEDSSGITRPSGGLRSLKEADKAAQENTGTCVARMGELGWYCEDDSDCATGNCQTFDCYFFLIFNCWKTCVPLPGEGQPGDFCTEEDQCESGVCAESYRVGDYECKARSRGLDLN